MKSLLLFLIASLLITEIHAQTAPVYALPDAFNFDYTLTQTVAGNRTGDSAFFHFYYTRSGEYAAAEWSKNENKKGNLLIVLTRAGNVIVFNRREKQISIMNPHKLMTDMMGMLKWIRMDSLMAHLRRNPDHPEFHSAKSGKTKTLGSYTSTEYAVIGPKQTGSIWIANVDFPVQSDYFMNMFGTAMMSMMGNGAMSDKMSTHPLMQAMMQPKALITDIEMSDSAGNRKLSLHTVSLLASSTNISTQGFDVNDYSNMTLSEIFEAEMKRRNN